MSKCITMFHHDDNELGCFQVVTVDDNKKSLEKLGFVDHIDKVKKPTKKATKKPANKVEKDAK